MQKLNKLLPKHSDKANHDWSNIPIQQIQSDHQKNINIAIYVFTLMKVLEFSTQVLEISIF